MARKGVAAVNAAGRGPDRGRKRLGARSRARIGSPSRCTVRALPHPDAEGRSRQRFPCRPAVLDIAEVSPMVRGYGPSTFVVETVGSSSSTSSGKLTRGDRWRFLGDDGDNRRMPGCATVRAMKPRRCHRRMTASETPSPCRGVGTGATSAPSGLSFIVTSRMPKPGRASSPRSDASSGPMRA